MKLTDEDRDRLVQVRQQHPDLAAWVDTMRKQFGARLQWLRVGDWQVGSRLAEGVEVTPSARAEKKVRRGVGE